RLVGLGDDALPVDDVLGSTAGHAEAEVAARLRCAATAARTAAAARAAATAAARRERAGQGEAAGSHQQLASRQGQVVERVQSDWAPVRHLRLLPQAGSKRLRTGDDPACQGACQATQATAASASRRSYRERGAWNVNTAATLQSSKRFVNRAG